MVKQIRNLGFGSLLLFAALAFHSGYAVSAPPIALIYNGLGSDKNSREALDALATKAGYQVTYFADSTTMTPLLASASLLIFGGTDDSVGLAPMLGFFNTAETIKAMKDFVNNGGTYIGICGGSYLASVGWQESSGSNPPVIKEIKALGLAPVRVDDYLPGVLDPIIIKASWRSQLSRPIYFQNGPKFSASPPDAAMQVFSRYADNAIAGAIFNSGKGKVILLGHHPEAEPSWVDSKTKNFGDWNTGYSTDDLSMDLFAMASDNIAPSVPTGLAAGTTTNSRIDLSWTASTDNLGTSSYRIYRDTALLVTLGPNTTYSNTGLAASTNYSYTVVACDYSGNCSAQSAALSATSAPSTTTTLSFVAGWNLVGNGSDAPMDAAQAFADATTFVTVWKWIAAKSAWAFHAPSLAAQGGTVLSDYVSLKGYQPLSTIAGGEGFWVNTKQAGSVNLTNGNAVSVSTVGSSLVKGWNLVSVGETATPKQFCDAQSSGVTTLWAWDSTNSAWYFYAPTLDAGGSLSSYISGKSYLDFTATGKTLGPGVGFWVNH